MNHLKQRGSTAGKIPTQTERANPEKAAIKKIEEMTGKDFSTLLEWEKEFGFPLVEFKGLPVVLRGHILKRWVDYYGGDISAITTESLRARKKKTAPEYPCAQ